MTKHVKVNGVWKQVNSQHVKIGGAWKTISQGWVKVNGSWKLFNSPPKSTAYSGITTGPSLPFFNMRALTADGESFYAIKNNAPYNELYKSAGGGEWVLHSMMSTGSFENTSLAYGNGVLISNSGYYSLDGGKTWTISPSSVRPTNYGPVSFSNGKFFGSVANTGVGTGAVVSDNGINWTFYSGNTSGGVQVGYHIISNRVVWTGQRYVCGVAGYIAHSTDFVTWTASTGSVPGNGFGVTGMKTDSGGKVLITEVSGGGVYTSTNHGVSFTITSTGFYAYSLIYANGYWVILPDGNYPSANYNIRWSADGSNWTTVSNVLPALGIWANSAYASNLGKWIAFPGDSSVTALSI